MKRSEQPTTSQAAAATATSAATAEPETKKQKKKQKKTAGSGSSGSSNSGMGGTTTTDLLAWSETVLFKLWWKDRCTEVLMYAASGEQRRLELYLLATMLFPCNAYGFTNLAHLDVTKGLLTPRQLSLLRVVCSLMGKTKDFSFRYERLQDEPGYDASSSSSSSSSTPHHYGLPMDVVGTLNSTVRKLYGIIFTKVYAADRLAGSYDPYTLVRRAADIVAAPENRHRFDRFRGYPDASRQSMHATVSIDGHVGTGKTLLAEALAREGVMAWDPVAEAPVKLPIVAVREDHADYRQFHNSNLSVEAEPFAVPTLETQHPTLKNRFELLLLRLLSFRQAYTHFVLKPLKDKRLPLRHVAVLERSSTSLLNVDAAVAFNQRALTKHQYALLGCLHGLFAPPVDHVYCLRARDTRDQLQTLERAVETYGNNMSLEWAAQMMGEYRAYFDGMERSGSTNMTPINCCNEADANMLLIGMHICCLVAAKVLGPHQQQQDQPTTATAAGSRPMQHRGLYSSPLHHIHHYYTTGGNGSPSSDAASPTKLNTALLGGSGGVGVDDLASLLQVRPDPRFTLIHEDGPPIRRTCGTVIHGRDPSSFDDYELGQKKPGRTIDRYQNVVRIQTRNHLMEEGQTTESALWVEDSSDGDEQEEEELPGLVLDDDADVAPATPVPGPMPVPLSTPPPEAMPRVAEALAAGPVAPAPPPDRGTTIDHTGGPYADIEIDSDEGAAAADGSDNEEEEEGRRKQTTTRDPGPSSEQAPDVFVPTPTATLVEGTPERIPPDTQDHEVPFVGAPLYALDTDTLDLFNSQTDVIPGSQTDEPQPRYPFIAGNQMMDPDMELYMIRSDTQWPDGQVFGDE